MVVVVVVVVTVVVRRGGSVIWRQKGRQAFDAALQVVDWTVGCGYCCACAVFHRRENVGYTFVTCRLVLICVQC